MVPFGQVYRIMTLLCSGGRGNVLLETRVSFERARCLVGYEGLLLVRSFCIRFDVNLDKCNV